MKEINLRKIIRNKEVVNKLLEELNDVAQDIDYYDYGLPISNEEAKARMREVVYEWIAEAEEALEEAENVK